MFQFYIPPRQGQTVIMLTLYPHRSCFQLYRYEKKNHPREIKSAPNIPSIKSQLFSSLWTFPNLLPVISLLLELFLLSCYFSYSCLFLPRQLALFTVVFYCDKSSLCFVIFFKERGGPIVISLHLRYLFFLFSFSCKAQSLS